MPWTPTKDEQMAMAQAVVLWIKTARKAGYRDSDWLPTDADISKSALLERIRSGKDPLDEPPPLGLSHPWYALVEDAGPYCVHDVRRGGVGHMFTSDTICALQYPYKIVEERSDKDFIVCDGRHDTSYRFRLWFDKDWGHPNHDLGQGGWFMQNVIFSKTE